MYRTSVLGVATANLPSANIGRMENKGFEIELTHNNKIGSFEYWVKANVSFARNKVLYQDEPHNHTRIYSIQQTR